MSLELILDELGDALLGLLAGGAVTAMLVVVLNYVTSF